MAADPPPLRKPGRPRVPDPKPGAVVSAWIPSADYDRIIKAAAAQDVTISALVRTWLRLRDKS
jgi:hypothetical protein